MSNERKRSKPTWKRKTINSAVALALTAMAAPQVMAATTCPGTGSNNTINVAVGIESGCILMGGDTLTISAGATITDAAATPVRVTTGATAAALNNDGNITATYVPAGTFGWSGFWTPAVQGAFTTLTNTGTIAGQVFTTGSSGSLGIQLIGTSGTLTNTGTISAGITAIAIGSSPTSTGSLASLSNSGTIQSTQSGVAINVASGSTLTSLTNKMGGIITGVNGGVNAVGATAIGQFVNHGSISATGTGWGGAMGVSIAGGATPTTLSGGLTNTGTISGSRGGVQLDTVTVGSVGTPADITNSGRITGSAGIGLDFSSSTLYGDIINQVGGVISYTGSGAGTSMGINVSGSTLGSISNSGTVNGGIVVRSRSALSGSITNASGGVITASGWGAIELGWGETVAGDVTNAGSITAARNGIKFQSATVTGALVNSGSITAGGATPAASSGTGIFVSSGMVGSISNSGTISAFGGDALDVGGGATINGDITNTVTGVISAIGTWAAGASIGSSTVSGGFINRGTINAGGNALSISGTNITNGILNTGTITSINRYAVEIGGMTASSLGALTNSGIISGGSVGMKIGSTVTRNNNDLQTINNSGTIEGLGTGAGFFNGYGINLYFATLTSITNSGIISGSQKSIFVDTVTNGSTSVLTDLFIGGNNTAQFNGMVDAQATATSINAGATYTLRGTDDFRVASFTNNGTAQFAAGATTFDLTNVAGNTFTNNDVLSVGAGDTGTLTGNYTQAANGTLRIGASGDTTYGKMVVSGTATLPTNAKIDVNVTNPNFAFTTASMAGVLSATTLTSDGTFAVTDNSALFNFTANQNGNAVDLALAAAPSSGTGRMTNAFSTVGNPAGAGAARVIDSLVSAYIANGTTGNAGMDAVLAQLGTFTTDADLVAAVMQTVPQVGAAMNHVSAAGRAGVTSALAARIRAVSGKSSGDGFVTNGNAWVKPVGAWAKQDDNSGVSGYKANTYGLVAGADGEMASGARVGMALGVTSTSVDANGDLQSGKVTGYQVALYGSKDMAGGYMVDWQGDYGYNQNSSSRRIVFMGTTASSDYTGMLAHVGAGVARDWKLDSGDMLTPSLRADYTYLRNDGYTETGAGALNLTVGGQTYREALLVADVTWMHRMESGAALSANLGAAYNAKNKQDDITSSYSGGGAAFGTSGIKPSSTTPHAGLGYSQITAGGMEVSLRYDVEARSGYTAQSVSAKLGKLF